MWYMVFFQQMIYSKSNSLLLWNTEANVPLFKFTTDDKMGNPLSTSMAPATVKYQ
jgi:hypothetical protein